MQNLNHLESLDNLRPQNSETVVNYLPISNYHQNMVLTTTLLDNSNGHLNDRCKRCRSCHKMGTKKVG